ncbi:hypothetical protein NG798_25170 [Ancylothrix sp. C2]|uniref:hypothetical protein n=1 Tax=Ancylothrix sp. D3o TaxID=2953691 RepID=UPI0021BB7FE9|nr:hypothetical protein [Ancylothrix sp. D3o]MCT7953093.1 hypothetical protein [Ancylothrix sp. D3o]
MARLPSETVTKIFSLQQQFLEKIDEAGLLEFILFEQFGETEETIPELEELHSNGWR